MKHRLLFASLLALLSMVLYTPLLALQDSGDNVISIKLSELPTDDDDEPIPLSLSIVGEGDIIIEGVQESYAADRSRYTPTQLDITIHGAVTSIDCNFCSVLSSVDITGSSTIQTLSVKDGSITTLKATGVKSLTKLQAGRTDLSEIDLTGCSALKSLLTGSNLKLKSVTLEGCTALEEIELQNGEIQELNLAGFTHLKTLEVQRNPITTLHLTGLSAITSLNCAETKVTSLDLSDCVALEYLSASTCSSLASIQMPSSGKLQYVYLQGGQLEQIDLSNLTELKEAGLNGNKLTQVRIANCPSLKTLSLHLNALSAEATTQIAQDLCDHGADYNPNMPAFKLFATGKRVGYNEENTWSAKAASIARRKGWVMMHKDEDTYETPMPIFTYAEVSIQPTAHGTITLKGFDAEELPYLPQGETYTVVATPDEGYELSELLLNDESILKEMQFDLFGASKLTATFTQKGGEGPTDYQYYLTKVEPSIVNENLKTYTYGYDKNKRWESRTEKDASGNLAQRHKLLYDDKGRISDIEITVSSDKDGKPSMFAHYTYDEQDRIIGRQMTLFTSPMANYKIVYRADGQLDYWADEKVEVMNEYLYNNKGQLIEERFGSATDFDKPRPTIASPSGKTFYSYDEKGRTALVKMSAVTSNWLYIKGEELTWNDQGHLSAIKAVNYKYEQGETDPEKGKPQPMFELRYQYDNKPDTKVFWPKLPFTEDKNEYYEFSYRLNGYCHKAEYWGLSSGKEIHTLDFVYTFDASPTHLQELVQRGKNVVQYQDGMITVEGVALKGVQIYDAMGQLIRDYHTEPCQRISMGIRELQSGLYIVQTISSEGTQTDKVIISQ